MNCEQVNKTDMVDYLYSLNFKPDKVRNYDYWYFSPFRNERTPSFKVDRNLNVWYDHAEGKGGNLVDFGITYFNCSTHQFLHIFSSQFDPSFSFHPHRIAGEKKEISNSKIHVLSDRPLKSEFLLNYLDSRHISFDIAREYCREVEFELYGGKHIVIGFKNNSGGFELRSRHFKGSSAPKDVTLIDENCNEISVFEGFFNFLSWQAVKANEAHHEPESSLILNSLSFFERQIPLLESKYKAINLFLDRDAAGIKAVNTVKANPKFQDRSLLYVGYNDLNEKLVKQHSLKRQKRFRRGV
jgi:hypothetical protein